ncbi:apolipoprotein N-acyltransferase [Gymnodinialimonas sp. 2305UL16-5]|uniref:apolipoprotein N-acyltransferase n=1 Tax=Gymnodinialimonas mytili TaxID=3126503 RepID=UPI0030A39B55
MNPAQALMRLSGWRARGLCAAAGSVAALALPPFDLWPALFLGFSLALALIGTAPTSKAAAGRAWWVGLGWFGVTMHWIVQPFFVEPEIYGWMAPFALVLMAGGLALFWALAGGLAARFCGSGAVRFLALVGLLTLTEALRGRIFTGLPWAQPGHGLIGSEALALSAFVGPLGLTLVLLVLAGASAALLARPLIALAPLAVGLGLGVVPLTPDPLAMPDDAATVRIVQINAPQHLKWDADYIPVFFQRALTLTAEAPGDHGAPDLVVWPETSLPDILRRSDLARAEIAGAARGAQVILGGQRYAGIEPRNILALLDPAGGVDQIYDKHHLVPFGEYLPLRGLTQRLGLQGIAAQLSGGYWPGAGPSLIDLGPLGRAFPMICYEAIFPHYLRALERPDFMVVITNDAWFGSFAMPHQHLALAQLRAAEQGLPVIRAANTGISAMIDGRGQIVEALPMDIHGIIDARLPPPRPSTLYARTGDLPVLAVALLITIIGSVLSGAIERRPKAA